MKRLALVLLAGCGSFEDPNIVLDLRVLAMTATVPDQVIDVDTSSTPQASELLKEIVPTTVCVLLGDPMQDRRLRYTLTMCQENSDERCAGETVQKQLATGTLDDPDTTTPEPQLCVTVPANGDLLGVLLDSLDGDTFKGLDGIAYQVALQVGGELDDPIDDIFASKEIKVTPRIPADRTGNQNPSVDHFDVRAGEADDAPRSTLLPGRCIDQPAPLVVAPETKVRLTPVEPDGVRETYVLPTITGEALSFTESLTYQWSASQGEFSKGTTGGKRDLAGNPPALFTDWKAPTADDLANAPADITFWIVQRDERLGAHWYEGCIRVVP